MQKTDQSLQVTKKGLESLIDELDKLKNGKRPPLVKRLANARAEGDLKENSDYQNAKSELEFLDGRIQEIEGVVDNAIVVKATRGGGVSVGSKVTIKAGGAKHVFEIVGEWEADPINKKVSPSSPIGLALVGKKVGEKAEVEAPAGKVVYEILSIDS